MGDLMADIYEGTPSFDVHAYKAAGETANVIAVKASEGGDYHDHKHTDHVQAAHGAGLSVVHYHFARPDDGNSPEAEARNFLAAMGDKLHEGDWVALDYERFTGRGALADVEWINGFWRYVHDHAGKDRHHRDLPDRSILYASQSYLEEFIGTGKLVVHRLWDAAWSTGPDVNKSPYHTVIRQQSGDGYGPGPHLLPGIGGSNCDVDKLHPPVLR